jgi:LDH2 family malate/lactate/ureidoglycolate dehydrogenase
VVAAGGAVIDPKVVDTSGFFDGEVSRYADFIRATAPVSTMRTK